MSKTRYHSLDSLRGLAALQVIILHAFDATHLFARISDSNNAKTWNHDWFSVLVHSPLSFFWGGTHAVRLFFVLSGFVLSIQFLSQDKINNYPNFFVKRILRLYIPCLAIILISAILQYFLYEPNKVSMYGDWVKMMWDNSLIQNFVHLATLDPKYLDHFDRALWSLNPEIKLSLLIPFSVFLFKRIKLPFKILFVIGFSVVWHAINKSSFKSVWNDFSVLYFFPYFLIGIILCEYRIKIVNWINTLSNGSALVFLLVAIAIYTYDYLFWWLPNGLFLKLGKLDEVLSAVASIMFLILSISKKGEVFLNYKPILFLGKISFSIYLIHCVAITTLIYLLKEVCSPTVAVFAGFVVSFPFAYLFYKIIEVPSMHFASYLSNLLFKVNKAKLTDK